MLLFRTIHGSTLYRLNHANSDLDYYQVIANRDRLNNRAKYASQRVQAGVDTVTTDLSTFMRYCHAGVPQALEALFSDIPEIDKISDFRHNFYVDTARASVVYKRTIRNFLDEGDYKKVRHACRLVLSLTEIVETGRFHPALTDEQVTLVSNLAENIPQATAWIDERIN